MGLWFSKTSKGTDEKTEESKNKESNLEKEVKHLKKRIENQDEEIKKNKNDISKNSSKINKINKTLEEHGERLDEHGERLDNNDKWFKQLVSLSEKMDKRIEVTEETCKGTQKTLNNSMNILDIHRKMLFPSKNDLKTPLSSRKKQIENSSSELETENLNQEAPIPAMITDNNLNYKSNEL